MEKKKAATKKQSAPAPSEHGKKESVAAKKEGTSTDKKQSSAEGRAPRATTSLMEKTEEELVDLTSRVYKLVVERGKDGVLQSEIWKELGLTSRDGSRLAIRLEKRGMIKRVKVLDDGRWTYKLTPLRLPANISSMESAPCIVCPVESKCSVTTEVNPFTCPLIGPWVLKEHRESDIMVVATTPA
jgi:predicted DNA-binding transcriptional regulator